MTRKQIITLLIALLSIILYIALFRIVAGALASESRMPPCTPQAPNLATRDACHTQTARAARGTSTATVRVTVTRIPSTPTRLPTGTQTPHPVSVVLAGVTYPLDIDRDCVRKAGHLECLIAIWVVVEDGSQATPTSLP